MSSSSKIAAINDLQRMAQQFRGILTLADELKDFVSFEKEREGITKQIEDDRKSLNAIEAAINLQRLELKRVQQAVGDSTRELEQDRVHAADFIAAAHLQAEEIVKKAHVSSEAVKRTLQEHVDGMQGTRDALQGKIDNLRGMLIELSGDYGLLQGEHAALVERTKKLQEGLLALTA